MNRQEQRHGERWKLKSNPKAWHGAIQTLLTRDEEKNAFQEVNSFNTKKGGKEKKKKNVEIYSVAKTRSAGCLRTIIMCKSIDRCTKHFLIVPEK